MTEKRYVIFESFFDDHGWNPSEELLHILAETSDKIEAEKLEIEYEKKGKRVYIQVYECVQSNWVTTYQLVEGGLYD